MGQSSNMVRVRLRALQYVRNIFSSWEWPIARQARTVEHAFDDDLARAGKSAEARMQIEQQRAFEADEYWDELRELRSMRLMRQGRRLHIHVGDVKWAWGSYGNRYLDYESEVRLYRAVRDERRGIWEFRIKVLTALTGLIGVVIGLVAFLKK